MYIIKYFIGAKVNIGTEEEPIFEDVLTHTEIRCSADALDSNLEIARAESYNGEYTIEDDGQHNYPVAPHNIVAGEYITVNSVLYLATENIPSGEPIIVGQNAVETTVEEQLYELTNKEEE